MINPSIGLVGPCGAGKSTLAKALRERNFIVKHIAQEHSFVQDMWKKIGRPTLLIFLDVSFPVSQNRRKMNWSIQDYEEEQRRLGDARKNADFYVMTDTHTPEEVLSLVITFLENYSQNSQ